MKGHGCAGHEEGRWQTTGGVGAGIRLLGSNSVLPPSSYSALVKVLTSTFPAGKWGKLTNSLSRSVTRMKWDQAGEASRPGQEGTAVAQERLVPPAGSEHMLELRFGSELRGCQNEREMHICLFRGENAHDDPDAKKARQGDPERPQITGGLEFPTC